MGSSAFEILIVPAFVATVCSLIAGAAILALKRGIEALIQQMLVAARSCRKLPRTPRDVRRQFGRTSVRGVRRVA
jgi:hypothetical protein